LGTGKTIQAILVAVFLGFMLSSPISPVSSCRSALGTITAGGMMLVRGAGREGLVKGLYEKILK
jgi:hypothetical protein